MYPQALLKQAELFEISWKSGSIDIEISINSEHEWLSGPDALRTPNKPALECNENFNKIW